MKNGQQCQDKANDKALSANCATVSGFQRPHRTCEQYEAATQRAEWPSDSCIRARKERAILESFDDANSRGNCDPQACISIACRLHIVAPRQEMPARLGGVLDFLLLMRGLPRSMGAGMWCFLDF